ncbi:N-acetylmuramic acid 6-phosphate etherase [Paenarthrobacter sp. PH39-S1]|uniref:N-acetylmuramic acid 6-phosphate etherase n=1 Tax=Paenarthrobacter sp. PH39-S1 TaxID=3046204 RepID=UPI0024B95659|nr:N-acetylmuramic acid 6-phosphate etherase [Paenarthrobacter sp. PH39-S1]MDJ0354685.1 N-acetylmuramic acid 6-phosphate etherase [Paenarthrobacter sp. PH39-S1]
MTDPNAALRTELTGLTTEAANPELSALDTMGTLALVQAMNAEDSKVPAAIAGAGVSIARTIDAVAERMARGGRLIYVGAGTSGRLGVLDASECPPTFGTDPSQVVGVVAGGEQALRQAVENAEDDDEAGAADMRHLSVTAADAVVGISASGRTPYVLGALAAARETGALTVGLSCNADSPLGAAAGIAIEIEVGPEFVTGSTRLKAGTAQKLVLNMISTLTMIRLGKTYGSLMVDLKATNAKLRARSERTVMQATGAAAPEAAGALAAVDGSVKAAILLLLTGLPPEQALELLREHRGQLRSAIGATGDERPA